MRPALPGPIIAVVGLAREASIAEGPGVSAIVGGANSLRLAIDLERAVGLGAEGVISFGISGGLDPALAPGAIIVGTAVSLGAARWATHAIWTARLKSSLPHAILAEIAGSDRPLASARAKRMLRATSSAAAVDMESHVAARVAAAHDLPFAIVRVVCDPAERGLPPAALAAMRPDGRTDIAAVLLSLLGSPGQFAELVRLSRATRVAFAELRRSRAALSPTFALP